MKKEIGWGIGFGGGGAAPGLPITSDVTFSLSPRTRTRTAGQLTIYSSTSFSLSPKTRTRTTGTLSITATSPGTNVVYDSHYWEEEDPSGTSGTFNLTGLTVASNNNRLLVAVITARNSLGAANTDISGVTWNSNALTERIEDLQIVNATRTEKMWLFDLTGVNVSTGNNTLAVSYTGSSNIDVLSVHVASYYNVTAGAGVYEHTNSAGVGVNSISDSTTPASENSLVVVASMLADPTGTWTSHDASLTEISDAGADAIQVCYSHDLDSSGSTLNYTETPSITNRRLSTVSAAYERA